MKKAFIQLHLAVFLAGFTGVLGRLITLNAVMLVWWRLLLSAVSMWVLFTITGRIQKISRGDVAAIAGIGFIAALHWVSFYGSIKFANVSVALVCFSSIGFFTAIFEPLITKSRFKPVELLLGLLVIAGIYIIFHFDSRYKAGIIAGILSAMLGAVFPIFNRQLMQHMNAATLMTYELSGGFLALSAIVPFYLQKFPDNHSMPFIADWLWLLFLSWICTVWALQLSANALKKLPAFTVNLTYNLEPVYGILLAFVIYRENAELDTSFYVGLFFILVAVGLQTLQIWRQSYSRHVIRKR